jgi:hypothetical protein
LAPVENRGVPGHCTQLRAVGVPSVVPGERLVARPLVEADPTDLEELRSWASIVVLFGGLAVAVIIGLVVLAFCAQ